MLCSIMGRIRRPHTCWCQRIFSVTRNVPAEKGSAARQAGLRNSRRQFILPVALCAGSCRLATEPAESERREHSRTNSSHLVCRCGSVILLDPAHRSQVVSPHCSTGNKRRNTTFAGRWGEMRCEKAQGFGYCV